VGVRGPCEWEARQGEGIMSGGPRVPLHIDAHPSAADLGPRASPHNARTLSYRRLKRRASYQRPTLVSVTDQDLSEGEIPAASLEQAVATLPPQGTACQLWRHRPGQRRAVCMTRRA
jgi:hypothetical protein